MYVRTWHITRAGLCDHLHKRLPFVNLDEMSFGLLCLTRGDFAQTSSSFRNMHTLPFYYILSEHPALSGAMLPQISYDIKPN